MRISGALAKARPLTVEFEGDTLNITYRPSSYSVAELEKLVDDDAAGKKPQPVRIIEMMQQMIVTWDLLEENGEPIDVQNTERMKELPTSIFTTIMQTVKVDQSAGEAPRPSAAT
jgi:hypothetical protein